MKHFRTDQTNICSKFEQPRRPISRNLSEATDLTSDVVVDDSDRNQWLTLAALENGFSAAYLLGDSNLDGTVDVFDLNQLGINWQRHDVFKSDGNISVEGGPGVDSDDLKALSLIGTQVTDEAVTELQRYCRIVKSTGDFHFVTSSDNRR